MFLPVVISINSTSRLVWKSEPGKITKYYSRWLKPPSQPSTHAHIPLIPLTLSSKNTVMASRSHTEFALAASHLKPCGEIRGGGVGRAQLYLKKNGVGVASCILSISCINWGFKRPGSRRAMVLVGRGRTMKYIRHNSLTREDRRKSVGFGRVQTLFRKMPKRLCFGFPVQIRRNRTAAHEAS